MKKGIVILALLFVIIGCGEQNVLDEGTVVGREYDDYDTWWGSMCVAYKDGWCTLSIPVEEHDNDHWYVDVVGLDKEGKERTERHEVTETLYNLAEAGVTINFHTQGVVLR